MGAAIGLERCLVPLDRVRARALKWLAPLTNPFVRDRSRRVTVVGLASIGLATACTAVSPLLLLALGPIVLGVPHLVSDVRYLVIRPGLLRRAPVVLAIGVPLVLMYASGRLWPAALAPAAVTLASSAPALRRAGLAALWCAPPIALAAWPVPSGLALVHVHNALALALWWAWRASRPKAHVVIPLAAVAAALLAGGGALALGPDLAPSGPLSAAYHQARLGGGPWSERAVLVFALAQSIHYAVWLRLVPEDDRRRPTPRPFVASLRALRDDLGAPLLAGACVLWAGVWALAALDLTRAYEGYLAVARFHGPLELAVCALWIAEGRSRG